MTIKKRQATITLDNGVVAVGKGIRIGGKIVGGLRIKR